MSERPTGNDKTAIVVSIHDRVGTLRNVANMFAERDISLELDPVAPGEDSTGWHPPGTTCSSSSCAATPASRRFRRRSQPWRSTRSS